MGICTLVAEKSLKHVLLLSLENAGRYSGGWDGIVLVASPMAAGARSTRIMPVQEPAGSGWTLSGAGGPPALRPSHRIGASTLRISRNLYRMLLKRPSLSPRQSDGSKLRTDTELVQDRLDV